MGLDFGSLLGGFAKQATKTITDREDAERDLEMRKKISEFTSSQAEAREIASENRALKRQTDQLISSYKALGFNDTEAAQAAKAGQKMYDSTLSQLELHPERSARVMWGISGDTGQSVEDIANTMKFSYGPTKYDDLDTWYDATSVKLTQAQLQLEKTRGTEARAEVQKRIAELTKVQESILGNIPDAGNPMEDDEIRLLYTQTRKSAGLEGADFGTVNSRGDFLESATMLDANIFDYLLALETQDKILKDRLGESNYKPNSIGAGALADIQTLKNSALERKIKFTSSEDTQTFDFTGMSDEEQNQAIANIDADKNTVVIIKNNDGQTDNIIWGGSAAASWEGNNWKYSYP
tara:strand:+ start:2947 stop:3999 length:1053 start_codon:yes stop_codon:yes gene_type:complete